jgi:hypothetical protein
MLVNGKDVGFIYPRLTDTPLLSVDVHGYTVVDVVEVGEREGYAQASMNEALEEVRVRYG